MTTSATQSSSALGRRSLPSTFFESIQNARRYMERRDGEDGLGDGIDAGGDAGDGTSLQDSRRSDGSETQKESANAPQPAKPMAFAEVARRVWSAELEPNRFAKPEQQATRAVSAAAAAVPESADRTGIPGLTEQTRMRPGVLTQVGTERTGPERTRAERGAERGTEPGVESGEGYRLAQGLVRGVAQAEAQGLAHDANNLLSALRLYSELLCFSGVLHERHRHYADDLKLLSLRSQRLIEKLLLLADQVGLAQAPPRQWAGTPPVRAIGTGIAPTGLKAETDGTSETAMDWEAWHELPADTLPEAVSVADSVRRISGVLGTIARGTLEVKLPETAGLRVLIGEEPLERILVNLVANAAAAIREGGAIRIRAGAVGSDPASVALTVDDSGRGMSETELAAALGLQPDTQPASSRGVDLVPIAPETAGRKRGLGLAIVRQLVAESGGSFFVYSQSGRGTRIEICWPSADAEARAASAGMPQTDFASGPRPDLKAGSEPEFRSESKVRPLPFVSWKNPARPPLAAGSTGGGRGEITAGVNTGDLGTETRGSKGAVAC